MHGYRSLQLGFRDRWQASRRYAQRERHGHLVRSSHVVPTHVRRGSPQLLFVSCPRRLPGPSWPCPGRLSWVAGGDGFMDDHGHRRAGGQAGTFCAALVLMLYFGTNYFDCWCRQPAVRGLLCFHLVAESLLRWMGSMTGSFSAMVTCWWVLAE